MTSPSAPLLSIVIPAYRDAENILGTLGNVTTALAPLGLSRRGVEAAAGTHIVMVHGDDAWGWRTLREFFSRTGEADIIVGLHARHVALTYLDPHVHLEDAPE